MKTRLLKAYVIFIALIMPLIVVKTTFMSRLYTYAFASPYEYATDNFLVIRTISFVVFSVICAVILMTYDNKRIGLFPVLFVCLSILSSVFSRDHLISLVGCDEQFEGLFVLLSYPVVYYAAKKIAAVDKNTVFLKRLALLSLIINSVICILQGSVMGVKAYGSLYNSNYAGFFLAILMSTVFWMLLSQKGKKTRILSAVTLFFFIIAIIMTGARAAMVVSLVSALMIIMFYKFKNTQLLSGICAAVVVVFAAVLFVISIGKKTTTEKGIITDVRIEEDGVVFDTGEEQLMISFDMPDEDHYYFLVKNREGKELEYGENEEGTMYELLDHGSADLPEKDFSFTIADYGSFKGFLVYTQGRTWYFYRSSEGEYFYLTGYTRPDKFVKAPCLGFGGRESFASNRGYIWSRTLGIFSSMSVKEFLFGTGPDTFATVFPQNDVNKYLLTDIPYKMIITRPHSFYLQVAVQLGFPMLIILVWMGVSLFVKSVKRSDPATAITILAFVLCGFFYDSIPVVIPVFLLLIGMDSAVDD